MKSVVVYDSQFGNTGRLAEAIAAELRRVGTVQVENVRAEGLTLPSELDLLVVGGPTQNHSISPPVTAPIETVASHRLDGVSAAAFDTDSHGPRLLTGAASSGIAWWLEKKAQSSHCNPRASWLTARKAR